MAMSTMAMAAHSSQNPSGAANPGVHGSHELPLRRIAAGISAASAALKGFHAAISLIRHAHLLRCFGTNPDLIIGLKAAKIIAKSFKISKTVIQSRKCISNAHAGAATTQQLTQKLGIVVKGCKAFYGAFTVLRFAKSFGFPLEVVSMLNWNFLMKGYKLSKSVVNVMEVIVGVRGGIATAVGNYFLVMKGTVQGVGVMMKAAFLSKELCILLLKAFGISRGTTAAFEAISEVLRERHSHANLSKRVWCTPVNEDEMHVLLRTVRHKPSLFNKSEQSSCSIMLLVKTLTDAHKNLDTHRCLESDHSLTFSLAVPMPTIQ